MRFSMSNECQVSDIELRVDVAIFFNGNFFNLIFCKIFY